MSHRSALVATFLLTLNLALAQSPGAEDRSTGRDVRRFDGTWDATVSCPNEEGATGARGYKIELVAEVKSGTLRAQHRDPDSPGSLTLAGQIGAEGIAELNATGRTGHPDYAIKRPSSGTPYSYRIKASFEENRATGSRIDSRPCSFTALKRPGSQ